MIDMHVSCLNQRTSSRTHLEPPNCLRQRNSGLQPLPEPNDHWIVPEQPQRHLRHFPCVELQARILAKFNDS